MAVGQIDAARKWTIVSQNVAQPAAATDWSVSVPSGLVWRVRSLSARFASSSTVATRVFNVIVKDSGGNILYEQFVTSQTASSTGQISAAPNVTTQANASIATGQIPEMVLPEGATIGFNTLNISTGDQWSNIYLLVEQGQAL